MRSKEKSTNIYFIRHGQTDFPQDRIYCDTREDPALNLEGIYQAKAASVYFKDKGISAVYSSPALRTRMTANEISQVTGLEINSADSWVERRFGKWDGLFFKEIEENYPDQYVEWKKDKVGYTPEGGETIEDVRSRLTIDLAKLTNKHSGENIAVITHVGPIRIVTCLALEIPLRNYRQIRVDYASISRIDFGQTMNNLITLNKLNY